MITKKTKITANAKSRSQRRTTSNADALRKGEAILAAKGIQLTPAKRAFANTLKTNLIKNTGRQSIMAATNTTNIMAKPDFLEMLPLFVQKLLILDVYGSVAMTSRHQIVPYLKVVAENTKGETHALNTKASPFMNAQGLDPNFAGNLIKNETVAVGTTITDAVALAYMPIIPNTITIEHEASGVITRFVDDAAGNIVKAGETTPIGKIDYSTGAVSMNAGTFAAAEGNALRATYQYDNENVGPHNPGNGGYGYEYGARMGKLDLQLNEIDLVATAQQIACYSSIYSAFALQHEFGTNMQDAAKEAAIGEITAEINSKGFNNILRVALKNPMQVWDASPIFSGAVVPTDYLKMFKLKLNQAAQTIYQATRLSRPNRLIVGTQVASVIEMLDGFTPTIEDNVGPYRVGKLDQFEVICDPNYNPDTWVMCCKSDDIARNSALFGEYMPITATDPIVLANNSVQQGFATMNAMEVVNESTVIGGRITGIR